MDGVQQEVGTDDGTGDEEVIQETVVVSLITQCNH